MAQRKTVGRPRERRAREPQQQRATETRGAILREAETLFARDGFAGASLGALAEAVGFPQARHLLLLPRQAGALRGRGRRGARVARRGTRGSACVAASGPRTDSRRRGAVGRLPLLAPEHRALLSHEAANPDASRMPAVFSQVGQRIQAAMSEALREIHPEIDEDELHHYFSLITGTSLFYASAMQRFLAGSDDAGLAHSMANHRRLLLRSSQDFLDRLAA